MEIGIRGIDSTYYPSLERICRLFFTGCKFVNLETEAKDCKLIFSLESSGDHHQLMLMDQHTQKRWFRSIEKACSFADPSSVTKESKQTLGFAFLHLLQEYTGVRQPWGLLTGVRPTKLFHRYYLAGLSPQAIEQRLQKVYQIIPEKTSLLNEIVQQQQKALPDLYDLSKEVSIYIGIPFCPTKCAYCTFPAYSIQGRTGSVNDFLAALHEEIEAIGEWIRKKQLSITTIYFGGGTPTSITAKQMDQLLAKCRAAFPSFERVREITVEAGRPDTLEVEKLTLLKDWRIDRISINPQSFQEQTLKQIGRHHTVKETLEKYQLAREMGFNNINMDLIIGLPNEGMETFRSTLQKIQELRPESLTVHTLSFKRGSHMTQNKAKYRVAERDEIAEMVQLARTEAKRMGYVPYYLYRQTNILGNQENVGYALPGKESLYNIIIMEERQSILALGCGAVSKLVHPKTGKISRWANPKEPKAYIDTYQSHIQGKIDQLDQIYATN